MTIQQRQADAENWADAYEKWQTADDLAARYDRERIEASTNLSKAREKLKNYVGINIPTRVFKLPPTNGNYIELVKVTYSQPYNDEIKVELLRTEPNE